MYRAGIISAADIRVAPRIGPFPYRGSKVLGNLIKYGLLHIKCIHLNKIIFWLS